MSKDVGHVDLERALLNRKRAWADSPETQSSIEDDLAQLERVETLESGLSAKGRLPKGYSEQQLVAFVPVLWDWSEALDGRLHEAFDLLAEARDLLALPPTAAATRKRQAEARRWIERVDELTRQGLSIAQIAVKIGTERGKEPDRRTVKSWRARAKGVTDRETPP